MALNANDAAASSQRPLPPAVAPPWMSLEHAVHATGRFAALVRSRAPSQRPQTPPTQTPDATRPRQRQPQPHAPSPVQDALTAAARKGLIPAALASLLLTVTDATANPARRSEAAQRAAFDLAGLQDRAFSAEPYLAQLNAMRTAHTRSRQSLKDATASVGASLSAIYRDPAKAAADLKMLIDSRPGPGHAARDIREEPVILGPLKGGAFFGRGERAQALQAVPQLCAAVEVRGRCQAEAARDTAGLNDLKARPSRDARLADALTAQQALDAVQAAVPGDDPLNADMLLLAAHEAALLTTPSALADAPDLSPPYRAHLIEQMGRLADVRALLDGRDPSRAVDHFLQAAQVLETNLSAQARLHREGAIHPAQQAAAWAATAQTEMQLAARTIESDFVQNQAAAQRGILPLVLDFQRDMDARASSRQSHDAAMDAGPSMG